jgi:hypothetical protein
MILKLILKIWPSFVPIITYISWVIIKGMVTKYLEKKNFISGEFEELDKNGKKIKKKSAKPDPFSLKNKHFIITIYLSLILMIISFLFFAIVSSDGKGDYTPAQNIGGKIIPGYFNQN